MRKLLFLAFLLATSFARAQNKIDWDGKYQLQLSDLQSPASQIGGTNVISLHTASNIGFSFQVSNAEFLFTKNFNSKVSCSFDRQAASIVAPDSLTAMSLLHFGQYQFDLSELYARKFRKKLYEGKGTFSDASFFRPIYDTIQRQFTERNTLAEKETDMGTDSASLKVLHEEVLKEIQQLPNFCKTCKPPKKKKNHRH